MSRAETAYSRPQIARPYTSVSTGPGWQFGSSTIVGAAIFVGACLSVFIWGLPFWVPLCVGVFTAGLVAQGLHSGLTTVLGSMHLGMCIAVYAFDFYFWIPEAVGVVGVGMVCERIFRGNNTTGGNPVPVLAFSVASRLFLALATGAAVESQSIELPDCGDLIDVITGCDDYGGALFGILLGAIPGAPTAVNLVIAFPTNAALVWAVAKLARGTG